MTRPILNLNDVELHEQSHGERFGCRLGLVGDKIGAKKLGYNLTVILPGKAAWPCHAHMVNEEMFLILEGEGEVRIGPERYPIKTGDVIACPPGGAETAHQMINTSTKDLRVLAVSTKLVPEVVEYPDSNKTGVAVVVPGKEAPLRFLVRSGTTLDYWEGE
ncbi:MAG: cupin domain-containing protein [Myxococcota bacterium]